jgi:hypothetical protein
MNAWRAKAAGFLFPSDSDAWLTILRVGLGVHVVLYALSLTHDWHYLFGSSESGLLTRDLSEGLLSLESPVVPRIGWFVAIGTSLGAPEAAVLTSLWIGLLVAAGALVAGVWCRPAAIAAWLLHLCAAKSGDFVIYGVDRFMTMGLFYLMLSPLPDRHSLDHRWRSKAPGGRELLGFFRRVLQVHLCVAYFFGGLGKSLGDGWWNGENLWRALLRPPFDLVAPDLLVHFKVLFPFAGVSIVVLETFYPFFIWAKKTRLPWLIGILAMHVGIGLMMGMYMFALIMIILNVSAFGPGVLFARQATEPR